jgi:hypothetical protein
MTTNSKSITLTNDQVTAAMSAGVIPLPESITPTNLGMTRVPGRGVKGARNSQEISIKSAFPASYRISHASYSRVKFESPSDGRDWEDVDWSTVSRVTRLVPQVVERDGFSYTMLTPPSKSKSRRHVPAILPYHVERLAYDEAKLESIQRFSSGVLGSGSVPAIGEQRKSKVDPQTNLTISNHEYWQRQAQSNQWLEGRTFEPDSRWTLSTSSRVNPDTREGQKWLSRVVQQALERDRERSAKVAEVVQNEPVSLLAMGQYPAWIADRIRRTGYASFGPVRPPVAC